MLTLAPTGIASKQQLAFSTAAIAPGETFWTDDYIVVAPDRGVLDLRASFVAAVGGSTAIPSSIVTHAPRERRADRDRDGLSRHTMVCIDGASIRAYGSRARLHKGCHFTNHRSIFRLDFQPRLFAGVGADNYSSAIANGRCISEHRRFRLSVHDVTGNDRWYPLTVWFGCGVGSPYARTGWRTS